MIRDPALLPNGNTAILFLFFCVTLFQLFCLILTAHLTENRLKFLPPAAHFLLSFLVLSALSPNSGVEHETLLLGAPLVELINSIPPPILTVYAIATAALTVRMILLDHRGLRSTVTRASVQESLDNLPTGLCFALPNGQPILVNRRMDLLCRKLTGEPLRNADLFWDRLTGAGPAGGTGHQETGGPAVLHFDGGEVRTFMQRTILMDGIAVREITAVDTTDLDTESRKLQRDNEALAEMNRRLRRYSENAEVLTRQEEILAAKVRIHDEMGRALLATRYALLKDDCSASDAAVLLKNWARNVSLLRRQTVPEALPDVFAQFAAAAASVGVTVHREGRLPRNDAAALRLLTAAARECLTNAVKHAGASELTIRITQRPYELQAVFTNNGTVPPDRITEGGGLSGLRRRIEDAGGSMSVQSRPFFSLGLILPKNEEDDG